ACQAYDVSDKAFCETPDQPGGGNLGLCGHTYTTWFRIPANKALLDRYKKWLIIDTGNERTSPDGTRQALQNQIQTDVNVLRDAGYTEPLIYISGVAGRDLPFILQRGYSLFQNDPLHKLIGGWQAYWETVQCDFNPLPPGGSCIPPSGHFQCG